MTSYVENETAAEFSFAVKDVVDGVAEQVLKMEACPYEVQINVLLTDNEVIRGYNAEYRGIDKETDVLSFPNVAYEAPSLFEGLEENSADYFDPDSGELILGDIILSVDKLREQALSYGHSEKRELAFLVAHSMLHLCGYDHIEPTQAALMEQKQEAALQALGITRE